MTGLIIFVISIIGVFLLLRWYSQSAVRALIGRKIPEAASDLTQHPESVLLYFYHPQCGPCQQMGINIDQVAESLTDNQHGRIQKIDVSEQRELTLAFGINATPTTLIIKDGIVSQAVLGAQSLKAISQLLGR